MADPELLREAPALRLAAVARCAELLAALKRETPGVLSATVATADGLTVASTLTHKGEADKLSAMSGSIAALAAAMTREAAHGEPGRVILESSKGHIVSLKVAAAMPLVLTVVTTEAAVLGTLLWSCRSAAERIAECVAA